MILASANSSLALGRFFVLGVLAALSATLTVSPALAEMARFAPPAPIATFEAGGGDETGAQVVTDGKGVWIAAWSSSDPGSGGLGPDSDVLSSRSLDGGETWSTPIPVSSGASSDSGPDDQVALATDSNGVWLLVWSGAQSAGGRAGSDRDIFVSRSTDDGLTWMAPLSLAQMVEKEWGKDEHPAITTDGDGNWVVVWESTGSLGDTIGGDPDILVSTSTTGGVTWSPPQALAPNAASDTNFDSEPSIAVDDDGHWIATWASGNPALRSIAMQARIVISRSMDAGKSWTRPRVVAPAPEIARPDGGAQIAAGEDGVWLLVWESSDSLGGTVGLDRDIYISRSEDHGLTWSDPRALAVNAASDAGDDAAPVLVYAGNRSWAVAWHSWDRQAYALGADADLLICTSEDDGEHWTPPLMLNTNARSNFGEDTEVSLATDGAGGWVAVWQSNEPINGQVRGDHDVFAARASFRIVPATEDEER